MTVQMFRSLAALNRVIPETKLPINQALTLDTRLFLPPELGLEVGPLFVH